MASKKRTTAMQEAWIKAQKNKQRAADARDKAKTKRDGAELRKKYKNNRKSK